MKMENRYLIKRFKFPPEILFFIFQYLNESELRKAALTCGFWRETAINSNALWLPLTAMEWKGEAKLLQKINKFTRISYFQMQITPK